MGKKINISEPSNAVQVAGSPAKVGSAAGDYTNPYIIS